ncbi:MULTISPECIES: VIT1/CCC1 transporter family protein [Corynebacterium]|uniref:VIT1/CCC1 transporter family protein n=1 Tax=Corynebacterium TaxID=1716 RepID=UPI0008A3A641
MTVVVEPIIGSHVAQEPATPPQHEAGLGERMNRLRAGVLGANDGIVSTAAVVVGVAGATDSLSAIATAGLAAVVGGAISMALGEYVSVSSQRDSERVQGLADHHLVNPWSAAIASFLAFLLGAALPFAAAVLTPVSARVVAIFALTLVSLSLTGALSAKLGGAAVGRSVVRVVLGGTLALGATFLVGSLFGSQL